MGLGATIVSSAGSSDDLADASWVEVHERMGEPTTFRLRFDVDLDDGEVDWVSDERLSVGSTLKITTSVGELSECLVKGPVHAQRIHLAHGGEGSLVEVRGTDALVEMDREAQSHQWKDATDSEVVEQILQKYGLTADVASTKSKHQEDKHTLIQRESDLGFVRRLARRNGYLFWLTFDSEGTAGTAHFKRPPLDGAATTKLSINVDTPNIDEIQIEWDVERPTSFEASHVDLNDKKTLDGSTKKSPLTALGDRDLASITGDKRSMFLAAPIDEAGDLVARTEGAVIESSWFVRATCSTNLEALGSIVHAHSVVELEGAGSRHSGKYFVASVKHTIDPVLHLMEIELVRNAWSTR
ncbi:hypothetical protein BH09MYX1_BH09MYX1_08460 [soil metagenome]